MLSVFSEKRGKVCVCGRDREKGRRRGERRVGEGAAEREGKGTREEQTKIHGNHLGRRLESDRLLSIFRPPPAACYFKYSTLTKLLPILRPTPIAAGQSGRSGGQYSSLVLIVILF